MQVELRVNRSMFGKVLAEMREWIDRNGGPVKFESKSVPGSDILVRLEFSRDEVGFAFQRDWAQVTVNEAALAA